jgi:nitronate monooxygenase
MTDWPDRRILNLLGIALPIIQAPMAGAATPAMAIAVAEAGGLGSLPCAMLSLSQVGSELGAIRARTSKPVNINFFCHEPPTIDAAREATWRQRLKPYYVELGLDPGMATKSPEIKPFSSAHCELVEALKPEIVSFHFGLPDKTLLARVKKTGAKILSSATTVEEARWLEGNGCDAIIAQGVEAGGHRGLFLSDDISTQLGTMALVPQVADAVRLPVIAAGGIADARGIVAAFALGASAVQIGTSYLFCPEAQLAPAHRQALTAAGADQTVLTNIFSGRPARAIVNRIVRELGPMSELAPPFPLAGGGLGPLRAKSEPSGSADFIPLWSGEAARLGRELPAGELTKWLAKEALAKLSAP